MRENATGKPEIEVLSMNQIKGADHGRWKAFGWLVRPPRETSHWTGIDGWLLNREKAGLTSEVIRTTRPRLSTLEAAPTKTNSRS